MVEPRSLLAPRAHLIALFLHLIDLHPQPPSDARPNMAASLTDNGLLYTQPVCQNCQTSTTPLWRRDEAGSVLCNACGLFLKLHGRARPISLKTDVIKSRNRVKSAGQVPKKKVILDVIQPVQYRNLTNCSHHSTRMDFPQPRPTWALRLSTCKIPGALLKKPLLAPPIGLTHQSHAPTLLTCSTIRTSHHSTFSTVLA